VESTETNSPPSITAVEEIRFARFGPLALASLCLFACFYGLGQLPFVGPDEPRYAEVAREMWLSGDWITPRLADIHWFEKPALSYWLTALGFQLLGVSEFAARLGNALFATAGVFLLYHFGRHVHSARFGYLNAAALLSMMFWSAFARAATFDLPLTVCLALALLAFFLWEQAAATAKPQNGYWYLFAVAVGLALLAKGLVGIILPAGIIGLYLLLTRRWRVLWQPKLLWLGGLLLLATAATWYGPMLAWHGREFINEFIIGHHLQRYTSNKYKHPQPFYFFFGIVLVGCLPWMMWLIASAQRTVQKRRALLSEPGERLRLYLWCWVIVPLAFFSFSGSKLPGYILPVFPALALLIGLELERAWESANIPWAAWATTILLLLLAAIGWFAKGKVTWLPASTISALASLGAFFALLYLALLLMRKLGAATLLLPAAQTTLIVFAVNLTFPAIAQRESLREFIYSTKKLSFPGERCVFFINNHHSFDFYAPDMPLRDEKSELVTAMSVAEIDKLMNEHNLSSLIIITPQRWSEGITQHFLPLGRLDFPKGDDHVLICSPGCEWGMMRVWLRKPNLSIQ
jgi:4-amino-4-deoxy-L-arabinose transferase-like glycosyltransferase